MKPEYFKNPQQPIDSQNGWWCRIHGRSATHILRREGMDDEPHCNPELGGIMFPCQCEFRVSGKVDARQKAFQETLHTHAWASGGGR